VRLAYNGIDLRAPRGLGLAPMAQTAHKSLPLILAREFASNIATPVTVMDETGRLVYFNEPAERILGRTRAEVGELPPHEWSQIFTVERLDGAEVQLDEMPVGIAHRERCPAHDTLAFTTPGGKRHEIEVTAFPLLGRDEDYFGVVAVFWEIHGE
jgi:PAS domain-containing protein